MPPSGLPLSLLSVGALALASQLPAGSFAFGHEGHWGSAGAGIVLVAGGKILLLLRSEDVTEPGFWGIAGGAVDSGEDPLEAGLRELEEETALRFSPGVARDHLLGQTVWHSPNGRFRYTTSVVEVPASVMKRPIELNWENDEHRWVNADWLRANEDELHPGFRAKMDELIAIAFPETSGGAVEPEMAGSATRAGTGARRRKHPIPAVPPWKRLVGAARGGSRATGRAGRVRALPDLLYHGTTSDEQAGLAVGQTVKGETDLLYLTSDYDNAVEYAEEAARNADSFGDPVVPIVLAFSLAKLAETGKLEPDWKWLDPRDVRAGISWQEALQSKSQVTFRGRFADALVRTDVLDEPGEA